MRPGKLPRYDVRSARTNSSPRPGGEPDGCSSIWVYGWPCLVAAQTIPWRAGSDDAPPAESFYMSPARRPSGKTAPKRARPAQVASESAAASAASAASAAANESAGDSRPSRQVITDARAMRALAHPLRVALLETMRRDGEITATRAAELLDESPGNMSWHLQTLAKYGFVEETGEGHGRSRPWRMVSDSRSFETGMTDPDVAAAGEALERTFIERAYDQLREWWSRRLTYPVKWRRAAFITERVTYLTAAELAIISEEVHEIYTRYADRGSKEKRPAGALPIHLYAHGHPLPPTAAGN